jgi:putative phosphoesterase
MLIGICSDTHGGHLAMRRAVELFDRVGVEGIVHCGDVGGQGVFDELVGRPARFVWGNTDHPDAALRAYLKAVGIAAPATVPLTLDWAGQRIAVFHGHEPGFRRAATTLEVDYILHGHSHQRRDERIGRARVINPGALHRARVKSVATLDLVADELTFHEVMDG